MYMYLHFTATANSYTAKVSEFSVLEGNLNIMYSTSACTCMCSYVAECEVKPVK